MNPPRILVVEDEAIVAMDIKDRLALMGYDVAGPAATGAEALTLAEGQRPDLILMDVRLDGPMDGITAAERIRDRFRLPVVFLTAYSEDATLERAKTAGPFGYVLKPFEDRELRTVIEMALYKHRTEEEIQRLTRLYAVLSQVNQALIRARSREEVFEQVCRIVVGHGGFKMAWVGWLDPATARVEPVASHGDENGYLGRFAVYADDRTEGRTLTGTAVVQGRPVIVNDFSRDERLAGFREAGARSGLEAVGAFPIRFRGEVGGALTIYAAGKDYFHDREIHLLEEVAEDIAFGLEKLSEEEERGRAVKALRESEARFKAVFDSAGIGMGLAEPRGRRWIRVNKAFTRMTGFTEEELCSLPRKLTHPDDVPADAERLEALRAGRIDAYRTEKRYIRKDGTVLWMDQSVTPLRAEDGQIVALVAAGTDITERKEAEEALRRSEAEALRLAGENAALARIGKIISSNLNTGEVFDQFAEEVRQSIPFDRLYISFIRPGEVTIAEIYSTGLPIPGRGRGDSVPLSGSLTEHIVRTRQGIVFRLDDRERVAKRFPGLVPAFDAGVRTLLAAPLLSRDEVIGGLNLHSTRIDAYTDNQLRLAEGIAGQIAGAIDNARLFSEFQRTSRALLEQQRNFRELFDEAPVGYHELDAEGRIVQVNRTELDMLGYAPEEMLGRRVWEFIAESGESRRAFQEKISGTRPTGLEFERIFLRKDGTPIPVLIRDRLLKDGQSRTAGLRSTIQDVTERKKAEKELAALQEQFLQGPAHGGHRPPRRRGGPRLQQPPDRHQRVLRDGDGRPPGRGPTPSRPTSIRSSTPGPGPPTSPASSSPSAGARSWNSGSSTSMAWWRTCRRCSGGSSARTSSSSSASAKTSGRSEPTRARSSR